ncbi:MAG: pyruvate kinase [Lachnospiraceae bacterium]|nr:pyruvate kinase [Lachnospiraceae bacterium]
MTEKKKAPRINKKTKIVCTMGPNTDNIEIMRALVENGMDVARFNFSHGSYEEQSARIKLLKKVREEYDLPIAMLLDTKGPEIRTGELKDGKKVLLKEQETIVLTTEQVIGDEKRVSVTYEDLTKDVKAGSRILVDDGLIELHVEKVEGTEVTCRIINGGELGQKKGVNIPNVSVNLPAITQKDKEDIIWGIEHGFDYIAASFIRNAEAILEIKELLKAHGGSRIHVIAKIENAEGLQNFDAINAVADGVMVARGDLGVEIPAYEVPHAQKVMIDKCNRAYKPVITATQMLDSMMRNPRPTRAEIADVANAVYDGTTALMLSGETAVGKYPVEALKMMVQTAITAEQFLDERRYIEHRTMEEKRNVSCAVGLAAVRTSRNVHAKCIVTPTVGGQTARLISNYRPAVPIYAVTPTAAMQRRMQLYWGVLPLRGYVEDNTEDIVNHAIRVVQDAGLVKPEDLMVITAGDPSTNVISGEGAMTNMLYVVEAK